MFICYLRQLKRDHLLDDYTYEKVLPSGSTHGVLCGLPKVHIAQLFLPRTPLQLQPCLLPCKRHPTYLHKLFHSVEDSFSFAEWAKQYTHNGEFMCSFDVSSLFTNVPLNETIEICLDKLYVLANPPRLPRLVLNSLLLFATKKSHFVFDGQYMMTRLMVSQWTPHLVLFWRTFSCAILKRNG